MLQEKDVDGATLTVLVQHSGLAGLTSLGLDPVSAAKILSTVQKAIGVSPASPGSGSAPPTADFAIVNINEEQAEFTEVEEKVLSRLSNHIESCMPSCCVLPFRLLCSCTVLRADTTERVKAGQRPVGFRVVGVQAIHNTALAARFAAAKDRLAGLGRSGAEMKVQRGFHGVHVLCTRISTLSLQAPRPKTSRASRVMACCASAIRKIRARCVAAFVCARVFLTLTAHCVCRQWMRATLVTQRKASASRATLVSKHTRARAQLNINAHKRPLTLTHTVQITA